LLIGQIDKSTFVNYQQDYGGAFSRIWKRWFSLDANADGQDDLSQHLLQDLGAEV
jgi:hypothetical protein